MANNDIRYLTPINIEIKKEKYCRFRKSGIKYVDYKNPDFMKQACAYGTRNLKKWNQPSIKSF